MTQKKTKLIGTASIATLASLLLIAVPLLRYGETFVRLRLLPTNPANLG